ncbi:MAG: hypothetical protein AAEJ52_19425 [Myxococcota bacterium]
MAGRLWGLRNREGALALVIATAAALRVAVFAAGFPFFSNVDEHRHIDAVLKYSRGYLPEPGGFAYEPQMPTLLGMYGSPEYHMRDTDGQKAGPPPWRGSLDNTLEMIGFNERFLAGRPNLEASSPPVYYALAGAWMASARTSGLTGGQLLYWVRGLNAALYFALVLASFAFCRAVYPNDSFVCLGVPVLLAVFPQDAFYYITPDALSPILGAAGLFAIVGVVASAGERRVGSWLWAVAGLICALAFLTKYTNAVLLAVFAVGTAVALIRGAGSSERAKLAWMWCWVAFPIAIWLGRNEILFGDWLATGVKLERLGWGTNPVSAYFQHPILTPSGLWIFVTELIPTFWRGELAWHRSPMLSACADAYYIASSIGYLSLAAWGFASRARAGKDDTTATLADGLSLAMLGLSIAVLAVLSMRFVFGEATNPTADNPYLSQGRLVSCALLAFVLLYVRGIGFASSMLPVRLRVPTAWALLACTLAVVVVSELQLSGSVFASEYNWFHFP